MLNTAKNEFTQTPYAAISNKIEPLDETKTITEKNNANTIFTIGPAIEIFPRCSPVTLPAIITAPGAAKTNPKNSKKPFPNIFLK